jgi:anti-sigma B factor antagonist
MSVNLNDLVNETGPVKEVNLQKERAMVKLLNDIDMNCSPDVRTVFLELTARKIPLIGVDLTEVPYMDSSGLATLIETLHRVQKYKGKLVLFGLQRRVQSVFEIANLTKIFNIQADPSKGFGNG